MLVLLASSGLGVLVATQRHAAVAEQVLRELPQLAGNRLHDTHTAVLLREHGVRRICTRDTDFTSPSTRFVSNGRRHDVG